MNLFIWAGITTIISLVIFYFWIGKEKFKEIKNLYLYIIFTLPLSALVNLAIKKNIGMALFSIFSLTEDRKSWPLLFIFMANMVAPITEEAIKLLCVLSSEIRSSLQNKKNALIYGFILGFAFGIGEVWFLAYVLSLTEPETIQSSFWLLIGFFGERLLAIMGHAFMTAIALIGFTEKNIIKYYLLAVVFHYFINIGASLYQCGRLSLEITYVMIVIVFYFLVKFIWRIEEQLRKKDVLFKKEEILYKKEGNQ